MKDLAVLFNSVDALHAHYVEWVRFLEAKGDELRAQLAKLEAKKAKTHMPYQLILHRQIYWKLSGEEDFLDIVFSGRRLIRHLMRLAVGSNSRRTLKTTW